MKFPITREALQAFDIEKDREEVLEEAMQLQITRMVEQICKDLKQNMRSESCRYTKKFVWDKLQNIRHCSSAGYIYEIRNIDKCVSQLIEKLKEVFIGCDIITDPLKTYIIIDWS